MSCLPDWQEALRKQTYKEHVKEYGEDVATALSHCWANKWFLGCSYPYGVMKIINQWPAPRKYDVNKQKKKMRIKKYEINTII